MHIEFSEEEVLKAKEKIKNTTSGIYILTALQLSDGTIVPHWRLMKTTKPGIQIFLVSPS